MEAAIALDMGGDHRPGDFAVAEQTACGAEVVARLEQIAREAVPGV